MVNHDNTVNAHNKPCTCPACTPALWESGIKGSHVDKLPEGVDYQVSTINIELDYDKERKQVYLLENGVYKAQFAYNRDGKPPVHFHMPDCKMTNLDGIGIPGCSCKIRDLRDGHYRILIHDGKVRLLPNHE